MLDLVHLRSFVSVAHLGSFTLASQKLGIRQSTVSQHVQRLELSIGRRLLDRDTHHVRLTGEGEALLPHALQLLSLERQTQSLFEAGQPRGRLRLGISEDLVSGQLPAMLQDFIADYPEVELILTVALSKDLRDMQDRGDLDLVFAKRRLGDPRGEAILREPLVWLAAAPGAVLDRPVLPLIVFPPPSLTRTLLMEALDRIGRRWRIVCSCQSLSGLTAAARAGMGVLVQPRSLAPPGLQEVPPSMLPLIEDIEFILVSSKTADQSIVAAFTRVTRKHVGNGLSPSR